MYKRGITRSADDGEKGEYFGIIAVGGSETTNTFIRVTFRELSHARVSMGNAVLISLAAVTLGHGSESESSIPPDVETNPS